MLSGFDKKRSTGNIFPNACCLLSFPMPHNHWFTYFALQQYHLGSVPDNCFPQTPTLEGHSLKTALSDACQPRADVLLASLHMTIW